MLVCVELAVELLEVLNGNGTSPPYNSMQTRDFGIAEAVGYLSICTHFIYCLPLLRRRLEV